MKKEFLELLRTVKREGIKELIDYLKCSDFFIAPASTKWHGSFEGGLLQHSLNVCKLFGKRVFDYKLNLPKESIILCGLLHDLCKINLYIQAGDFYAYNKEIAKKGHAKRSLEIIQRYIKLTPNEINIIKYHMGFFATEILSYAQEYSSKELMEAQNKDPIVMLFHHVDNEESKFMGDK